MSPPETLVINDRLSIDPAYLSVTFVRSRGPGGQNVNKVNTRAQLRFDMAGCDQLSGAVKRRLAAQAGRRLTAEGQLIIESDRHRDQVRNRSECRQRLAGLIRQALIPPRPRIPTRPTAAARRRRRQDKEHRARTKTQRQPPSRD